MREETGLEPGLKEGVGFGEVGVGERRLSRWVSLHGGREAGLSTGAQVCFSLFVAPREPHMLAGRPRLPLVPGAGSGGEGTAP